LKNTKTPKLCQISGKNVYKSGILIFTKSQKRVIIISGKVGDAHSRM
jgi:hypothetical protein